MNQSALCSPDPELCFKYQNMCKKCVENFLEEQTTFASHTIFYGFGMSDGCRIFWQSPLFDLQMLFDVLLETFLHTFYICCRYLKHSLGSGEHNALWFMIVRHIKPKIWCRKWLTRTFLAENDLFFKNLPHPLTTRVIYIFGFLVSEYMNSNNAVHNIYMKRKVRLGGQ